MKNKKNSILALFLVCALAITGAFAFLTARDSKDNVFTMGKVKIELKEDDWYNDDNTLVNDKKEMNMSLSELETKLSSEGYVITKDGDTKFTAEKDGETLTYYEETKNDIIYVYESNGVNDFAENVLPNQTLNKAPYVKNVGNNDTYAYVKINIPVWEIVLEGEESVTEYEMFKIINSNGEEGTNDGWSQILMNENYIDGEKYHTYVFAYKDAIEPGEETPTLFDKVQVRNFKNAKKPIYSYSTTMFTGTDKAETINSKQSTLNISPIITASAYDSSKELGEDNIDELVVIDGTENVLYISDGTTSGSLTDMTKLTRIYDSLSEEELSLCQIFVGYPEDGNKPDNYTTFMEVLGTGKMSTGFYGSQFYIDFLNTITLTSYAAHVSLDDGQSHDDLKITFDYCPGYETTYVPYSFYREKVVNSLGTDKVDIYYPGYKATRDEGYYNAFKTAYSKYKTESDLSNGYDDVLYKIFAMVDADVKSGKIEDTNTAKANAFIAEYENVINSETGIIMYFNIRDEELSGLYVPEFWAAGDGAFDTVEPYNFSKALTDEKYLNTIFKFATLTGYEDIVEYDEDIDLNASGCGIQTGVADTPAASYYIGAEEQGWENIRINVHFADPLSLSFTSSATYDYGETITIPDAGEGNYWVILEPDTSILDITEYYDVNSDNFNKYYSYWKLSDQILQSGDKFKCKCSSSDIILLKVYGDTSKYLTTETYSNKTYLVNCNYFAVGNINIPSSIYEIYSGALWSKPYIKQITISGFRNHDNSYDISNCASLEKIILNADEDLGIDMSYLVESCDKLTSIEINSPQNISSSSGSQAICMVKNCNALEELTIPSYIGRAGCLVTSCKKLKTLNVPAGVGKYYADGFTIADCFGEDDNGVKQGVVINILANDEKSVSYYRNTSSPSYISEIHYDGTIENMGSVDVTTTEGYAPTKIFVKNSNGEEYFVQGTVNVPVDATLNITGYEYINEVINNSYSISSFKNCKNLSKIQYYGESRYIQVEGSSTDVNTNQLVIGSEITTFYYPTYFILKNLVIPKTVETIPSYCIDGNSSVDNVTFETEDGVGCSTINSYAFSGAKIGYIKIPDTVTTLGEYAFNNSKLKQIEFDENCPITSILKNTFYNCTSLQSITWPKNLTTIGISAFQSSGLSWVQIPSGVTSIGNYAFAYMKNLHVAYIPITVEKTTTGMGSYAFRNNSTDKLVIYVEATDSTGWSSNWNYSGWPVKYGATNVPTDEIDGVKYIYSDEEKTILFACETEKTSITLPSNILSISSKAFPSTVVTVSVPDTVTSINSDAFSGIKNVLYSGSLTNSSNWGATYLNAYDDGYALYDSIAGTILYEAYNINEDGVFNIISGCKTISEKAFNKNESVKTSIKVINIPEGVEKISDNAFRQCSYLQKVSIPSTVTYLGEYAFYDCDRLSEITFAENSSITNFGSYAFCGCSSLQSITLPDSLTETGTRVFYNCNNLQEVTLPDSLLIISKGAFASCNLETVDIPQNVVSIGYEAFDSCKLTEITIPDSVTTIESSAFGYNDNLKTVTLGKGVTSLDGQWLTNSCPTTFNFNCTNLTSAYVVYEYSTVDQVVVNIGENVECIPANFISNANTRNIVVNLPENSNLTTLYNRSFYNSYFKTIAIPNSVNNIDSNALEGILNATYYGPLEIPENNWGAKVINGVEENGLLFNPSKTQVVKNMSATGDVVIPDGVTHIAASAFDGSSGVTNISLPDSLTCIGNYAFRNTGILTLDIPDGVTSIGTYICYNCKALIAVTMPSINISDSAFDSCSKLSSVTINGNGGQTIGAKAFYYCYSLTDITIPEGYTKINSSAFSSCSLLQTVTLPSSLRQIGQYAFNYCQVLTDIDTSNISCIDASAFRYCYKLTSLDLSNVYSIGASAFYNCSALEHLTLTDKLVYLGGQAFCNCVVLDDIYLSGNLTSVYSNCFDGCAKLLTAGPVGGGYDIEFGWTTSIPDYAFHNAEITTLVLPENVEKLGYGMCEGTQLNEITIPATVSYIDKFAFTNCNNLTTINYNAVNASLGGSYVFNITSGTRGAVKVTFGEGVVTIPSKIFYSSIQLSELTIPSTLTTIGSYAFYGVNTAKNYTLRIPVGYETISEDDIKTALGITSSNSIYVTIERY